MGITRLNADPGTFGDQAPLLSQPCFRPGHLVNRYLQDTGDPSTINVGDDLLLVMQVNNPMVMVKHGFHFHYTDAAGSDFSGRFLVKGINNYGVEVEEEVVVFGATGSNVPKPSLNAYLTVTSIIVLEFNNSVAADSFEVGTHAGVDANTQGTALRIGFPWIIKEDDEHFGLVQTAPPPNLGDIISFLNQNKVRGFFTVNDVTTSGRVFQFVMNPDNPKL